MATNTVQALQKKLRFSVLIFVGPPLAGKGTQASILSKILDIPAVSTGNLFREEVKSGSELGKRMKAYMDQGVLIPNELTVEFLTSKFSEVKYQNGLILDGYPRDLSHVEIFDKILLDLDRSIFAVLHFDYKPETLWSRLDSRVVCSSCGEVYSTQLLAEGLQTCKACNGALTKRSDDSKEVMQKRFDVYEQETKPMVAEYEKRKLLIKLQPLNSPEAVTENILSMLSGLDEQALDALDSYSWLQHQLNTAVLTDDKQRAELMVRFRDKALQENILSRSGIMRRFVYLKTSNLYKYEEHVSIFTKYYGIEVLRVPAELPEEFYKPLLEAKTKDLIPLAIIREESNLYRPNSDEFSSLSHGVKTVNRASLTSHYLVAGKVQSKRYTYSTHGRIDLSRRTNKTVNVTGKVFGWDDIFIVSDKKNGLSYQQLRMHGIKQSSRHMVVSDFLKDRIHYKKLLDVQFNPQAPERVIDFGASVSKFVDSNTYYNNKWSVDYGFRNLQTYVLNQGVFFRAAKNRRQNNYWNPGLNGGIPLTKKKDEIHELTFMAHDFGHFAIPDLVFAGTHSVRHRRAYVAWRMASEATTMTLADMLFVDSLKQSGVDYDFNTRKIYPLFLALGINFLDKPNFMTNLKTVIKANYLYCLRGDDSMYRQLIKQNPAAAENGEEVLKQFIEKFMPFFVEDFRWTEGNYDNMVCHSDEMKRWWDSIKPLRVLKHLKLKSVDDFLQDISEELQNKNNKDEVVGVDDKRAVDQVIEAVFDKVFEMQIRPALEKKVEPEPENVRLARAFTRYMAGQMAVFGRYHFIHESAKYQKLIMDKLLERQDDMDLPFVNQVRGIYEDYLGVLVAQSLISKDDKVTFSELYPVFDPLYVTYDMGYESYEDLATVSERIFGLATHQKKLISQAEGVVGRTSTPVERTFLGRAALMVEESGGRIDSGLFVTKPGVMLLAETSWHKDIIMQHPHLIQHGLVTFLLCGVAVETSLELIAHKEAKVARLTSSKTNAMNFPLFRVQGAEVWSQEQYLSQVLLHRGVYEDIYRPTKTWGSTTTASNELWNITLPACKATALCYSMTLSDYHNLFIGRMGPAGNEAEVREVVATMAGILHDRYPQVILSPESYLALGNDAKYKTSWQQDILDSSIFVHHPSEGSPLVGVEKEGFKATVIAGTRLTTQAKCLFKSLHINMDQPDSLLLSEFRSRITYLAFPKTPETAEESHLYMHKLIQELHHLSILAASQIAIELTNLPQAQVVVDRYAILQQKFGLISLSPTSNLLVASMKDLVLFIKDMSQSSDPLVQEALKELVDSVLFTLFAKK